MSIIYCFFSSKNLTNLFVCFLLFFAYVLVGRHHKRRHSQRCIVFCWFFSRICCCFLSLSSLKITITESLNRRISFVFFQCNIFFPTFTYYLFLSIWNLFLFVWALRWYVDTQKDKERLREPIEMKLFRNKPFNMLLVLGFWKNLFGLLIIFRI